MMSQRKCSNRGALGLVATLSAVFTTSACISQQEHDELHDMASLYQRQVMDYEDFVPGLQAENVRLRNELELMRGESEPVPAGFTADIDERMAELQRMLEEAAGANSAVSVFEVEGGIGYRLGDAVLFGVGSAEILDVGREVLVRLAEEIKSESYRRIWVRGHTDSVPVAQAETLQRYPHGNLQLSSARAVEVAAMLIELELDATRVAVAGFGPNEPIEANDSAEGQKANRRVEIFVLRTEETP